MVAPAECISGFVLYITRSLQKGGAGLVRTLENVYFSITHTNKKNQLGLIT